jgi:hypothetical protein
MITITGTIRWEKRMEYGSRTDWTRAAVCRKSRRESPERNALPSLTRRVSAKKRDSGEESRHHAASGDGRRLASIAAPASAASPRCCASYRPDLLNVVFCLRPFSESLNFRHLIWADSGPDSTSRGSHVRDREIALATRSGGTPCWRDRQAFPGLVRDDRDTEIPATCRVELASCTILGAVGSVCLRPPAAFFPFRRLPAGSRFRSREGFRVRCIISERDLRCPASR